MGGMMPMQGGIGARVAGDAGRVASTGMPQQGERRRGGMGMPQQGGTGGMGGMGMPQQGGMGGMGMGMGMGTAMPCSRWR